jgi:hypothetical protein
VHIKKLRKNKDIERLSNELMGLEVEFSTHRTVIDEIQIVIDSILDNSEINEELPEQCTNPQGCLVDELKVFLPGRCNGKDWIQCGNELCHRW